MRVFVAWCQGRTLFVTHSLSRAKDLCRGLHGAMLDEWEQHEKDVWIAGEGGRCYQISKATLDSVSNEELTS